MALILPTIAYNIRAPVSLVLWVPLSSLLVEAAFMPAFGRLSDRSGRRKYFIVGLGLFSVGAILAGNSLTIYELLGYRVIQAFGGAFVLANGRAMIADLFEERRRGFALGTNVSTLYVAITAGTVIAATVVSVTQLVGWRYVFYFSGGLAAIDIPLAFFLLPESRKNPGAKMDWIGTVLFVVALGSLLTILTQGGQNAFGNLNVFIQEVRIPILNIYFYPNFLLSVPLTAIAAAGAVAGVLFVVREVTFTRPLIDFGLFRSNSMFQSTNLAALFVYISHWSTLTLLSFYLEQIRGLTVLTSGLILTVEPLFVVVFALVGGWIASRTGSRDPSIVGLIVVAAAMGLLSTITATSSLFFIGFVLAMIGVGVGIFSPSNTNANLGSVSPSDRGMANGVLGMMRFTGQSLSLAVGTLIIGYVALGQCVSQGCAFEPSQYAQALQLTFGIGVVMAVIAVAFAFVGREKGEGPSNPSSAQ
jgi:MFS family permease